MTLFKSIILVFVFSLVSASVPLHAIQLLWERSTSADPEIEFNLTQAGPVSVVASLYNPNATPGGTRTYEVRLDGTKFVPTGSSVTVTSSATATFRNASVSQGNHTMSLEVILSSGFILLERSLLVILEEEEGDLAEQVEDLSQELDAEIQARIAADQQVRDDLLAVINALEQLLLDRIGTLESDLASLRAQVETNTGDIAALNQRIVELEAQLAANQQVLEERIAELEARLDGMAPGDNSDLIQRIEDLENREFPVASESRTIVRQVEDEDDDDGLETYLIPAGIGLGSAMLVNLLWSSGGENEGGDKDAAEAASDENRPGFGSK